MAPKYIIPISTDVLKGSKARVSLITASSMLLLFTLLIPAAFSNDDGSPAAGTPAPGEKSGVVHCWLSGGKIYTAGLQGLAVIPLDGNVLRMQYCNDEIYYVRETSGPEGETEWFAGRYRFEGGASVESPAGKKKPGRAILRLMGSDGTLYMLAAGPDRTDGTGTFYKIELNGGGISFRDGVTDFSLCGGKPVFIERKADTSILSSDERTLPLAISGTMRIAESIGGRILFISNGTESEIIDIMAMKSIGLYSREVRYQQPGDFNLVVELADLADFPEAGIHVFYKVFLDGDEAGRTDTGPAVSIRTCRLKASPDTEHALRLERWQLDGRREKYERANNIRQPAPAKVHIPSHLVIRISGKFDGTAYLFRNGPVVEK